MRVLVVSNMQPDERAPQRGSFVRDQVYGLRGAGLDVELLEFQAGRSHSHGTIARIRRAIRQGGSNYLAEVKGQLPPGRGLSRRPRPRSG